MDLNNYVPRVKELLKYLKSKMITGKLDDHAYRGEGRINNFLPCHLLSS